MPPALQGGRGRHGSRRVGDQVRGGESLPYLLWRLFENTFTRLHVYPPIQDDEEKGGDVERPEGGVYGVKDVICVDTAAC